MAKKFKFRYVNEIVGAFVLLVILLLLAGVLVAGTRFDLGIHVEKRTAGHGGHAPADHALPRAHETRQHQIAAPVHSGTGWPQDASRVKSNLRTGPARRGAG